MVPVPSSLVRGEGTLARRGGWGVNILEDVRHSSVLYVCKHFVVQLKIGVGKGLKSALNIDRGRTAQKEAERREN